MTIIGAAAYHNLIRDNNQHFNNLATIPVVGITNAHLDIAIRITDPKDPNKHMMLREILLKNNWCSTIDTMHIDGRLFFTTTKLNLLDARQWIDNSFKPLYTKFLPQNPSFQPHPDYPVPRRTNRINLNPTTKQYAEKMLTSIPVYAAAVSEKNKFSKFPAQHHDKTPRYVYDDRNCPTLKSLPATLQAEASPTNTPETQTTPSETTAKPAATQNQSKHKVDLKAIQAELKKSLATDFTKLIKAALTNFQADMKFSFEKLDHRYDELLTTVEMLNKNYQNLNNTLT